MFTFDGIYRDYIYNCDAWWLYHFLHIFSFPNRPTYIDSKYTYLKACDDKTFSNYVIDVIKSNPPFQQIHPPMYCVGTAAADDW